MCLEGQKGQWNLFWEHWGGWQALTGWRTWRSLRLCSHEKVGHCRAKQAKGKIGSKGSTMEGIKGRGCDVDLFY